MSNLACDDIMKEIRKYSLQAKSIFKEVKGKIKTNSKQTEVNIIPNGPCSHPKELQPRTRTVHFLSKPTTASALLCTTEMKGKLSSSSFYLRAFHCIPVRVEHRIRKLTGLCKHGPHLKPRENQLPRQSRCSGIFSSVSSPTAL